jgi:hypothetical protein
VRYGVWLFFIPILFAIDIQLIVAFKLIEKRFSEVDFKTPIIADLVLFKAHQKECPECLSIIDSDSILPCKTGLRLIYEDNRKAGF